MNETKIKHTYDDVLDEMKFQHIPDPVAHISAYEQSEFSYDEMMEDLRGEQ